MIFMINLIIQRIIYYDELTEFQQSDDHDAMKNLNEFIKHYAYAKNVKNMKINHFFVIVWKMEI